MINEKINYEGQKALDEIDAGKIFGDIFNQHLVEHLEEVKEERDTSWWIPEKDAYHVTEITQCLRQSYLKRQVDLTLDESSLKNFDLGHRIENIAAKSLAKINNHLENDYRFKKEINDYIIKGETDPIERIGDKILDMYEIKSASFLSSVKDNPREHHREQVNAYMGLLGLNSCKILYIDKKNLSNLAHHVKFDKDMFKEFKNRSEWLHSCFKNDIIPDAIPQQDWECKWCDVKDICKEIKENGEEEVKKRLNDPAIESV